MCMPTSNSIQTVEIKDNDVCYEITDNIDWLYLLTFTEDDYTFYKMETPFKSIVTLSSGNHLQIFFFIIKKFWSKEESRPLYCRKQFKPILCSIIWNILHVFIDMLCFCCCMPVIPQLIIVYRLIRILISYDK